MLSSSRCALRGWRVPRQVQRGTGNASILFSTHSTARARPSPWQHKVSCAFNNCCLSVQLLHPTGSAAICQACAQHGGLCMPHMGAGGSRSPSGGAGTGLCGTAAAALLAPGRQGGWWALRPWAVPEEEPGGAEAERPAGPAATAGLLEWELKLLTGQPLGSALLLGPRCAPAHRSAPELRPLRMLCSTRCAPCNACSWRGSSSSQARPWPP